MCLRLSHTSSPCLLLTDNSPLPILPLLNVHKRYFTTSQKTRHVVTGRATTHHIQNAAFTFTSHVPSLSLELNILLPKMLATAVAGSKNAVMNAITFIACESAIMILVSLSAPRLNARLMAFCMRKRSVFRRRCVDWRRLWV